MLSKIKSSPTARVAVFVAVTVAVNVAAAAIVHKLEKKDN